MQSEQGRATRRSVVLQSITRVVTNLIGCVGVFAIAIVLVTYALRQPIAVELQMALVFLTIYYVLPWGGLVLVTWEMLGRRAIMRLRRNALWLPGVLLGLLLAIWRLFGHDLLFPG